MSRRSTTARWLGVHRARLRAIDGCRRRRTSCRPLHRPLVERLRPRVIARTQALQAATRMSQLRKSSSAAVTQGSNKARQAARWDELTAACDYLGFDLVATVPGGLEHVNVKTRAADPAHWSASVDVIARLLGEHRPATIFFPHDADLNSSHIGTHHLLVDALARQAPAFACRVVETEFWGAMAIAEPHGGIEHRRCGGDDDRALLPCRRGSAQPVSPPGAGVDAGQPSSWPRVAWGATRISS